MAIDSSLTVEAWSQGALQGFVDFITPLNAFSIDYGGDIERVGQVVNVPVYDALTAGTFAGDYTTNADNSVSAVNVTVDQHVYETVKMTDLEAANTTAKLEEMGYMAGISVAVDMFQNILSLVTNANFGAEGFAGLPANFDSDDVVDLKVIMSTDKVPLVGRTLVLDESYYGNLLKDSAIKGANTYGSPEGIQAGIIPSLFGFKVMECTAIPANGESLAGFAAYKSAFAIAQRYLRPQEGHKYSDARPLVDPSTGATLGLRKWYDESKGTCYMTIEANFGRAVGQDSALLRIVGS